MKLIIVCILLTFGNTIFSQMFFLRVTPSLYTSFGTYKNYIKESQNNSIEILPLSKLGEITWANLNYALQIDFIKIGKKLEGGFMIGNVGDVNGYVIEYHAKPSNIVYEGLSTYRRMLKTGSSRLDLGLSLSYPVGNNNGIDSRWKKKLTTQPMFSFNRTSNVEMSGNSVPMTDGILTYTESTNKIQNNAMGFAINFRFDWELLSKTKKQNILNFSVGYRQGFTVTNRSTYSFKHSNGMYAEVTSLSKTSAFFFGISKPLNFIKSHD